MDDACKKGVSAAGDVPDDTGKGREFIQASVLGHLQAFRPHTHINPPDDGSGNVTKAPVLQSVALQGEERFFPGQADGILDALRLGHRDGVQVEGLLAVVNQESQGIGRAVGIGHNHVCRVNGFYAPCQPFPVHSFGGVHICHSANEFPVGIVYGYKEGIGPFAGYLGVHRTHPYLPAGGFDDRAEEPATEDGDKFHLNAKKAKVMGDVAPYPTPGDPDGSRIGVSHPEGASGCCRDVHVGSADDTDSHGYSSVWIAKIGIYRRKCNFDFLLPKQGFIIFFYYI